MGWRSVSASASSSIRTARCTIRGGHIADDVMIGPNVSLLSSGHPVAPSQRRDYLIAKPIVIERNVWIAAGVTISAA